MTWSIITCDCINFTFDHTTFTCDDKNLADPFKMKVPTCSFSHNCRKKYISVWQVKKDIKQTIIMHTSYPYKIIITAHQNYCRYRDASNKKGSSWTTSQRVSKPVFCISYDQLSIFTFFEPGESSMWIEKCYLAPPSYSIQINSNMKTAYLFGISLVHDPSSFFSSKTTT